MNHPTQPLDAAGIEHLVRVALGQAPADLVIRGAALVNVFTEQVEPPEAVAVARGRVASLGPELPGWVGPDTQVVEAQGQYLLPGLIDAHTHLDSIFMLGPYVDLALPRGNTCAVTETSMIAGAWGVQGVRQVLAEAQASQMRFFNLTPSMCPPFPEFETSAGLGEDDFLALLADPACLGMGETYWPAVTDRDPRVGPRFAAVMAMNKRLGGHAAGAHGHKLTAYAASGITDCHEAITGEEAVARLRLGLAVQVREGFVRKEMDVVVPAIKDLPDTRGVSLVTDLAPPEELISDGAMNVLLRKAVALGVNPARAVAWCSLNPAQYFHLDRLGAVAPGYLADLLLVRDLTGFQVNQVYVEGELVAQDGKMLAPSPAYSYSPQAWRTIQSPELTLADLRLEAPGDKAQVRVVEVLNPTITKEGQAELPVIAGSVAPDPAQGVLKMAQVNRHAPGGKPSLGFTRGWGLTQGAAATTLIWDTCNIFGLGASDDELLLALNRARELGGGWVVVKGAKVLAELPMPICGVISPAPMQDIVRMSRECEEALASLGTPPPRPFLNMQTFCFTGLPFLRLTDKGLMDVRQRKMVPVLL